MRVQKQSRLTLQHTMVIYAVLQKRSNQRALPSGR